MLSPGPPSVDYVEQLEQSTHLVLSGLMTHLDDHAQPADRWQASGVPELPSERAERELRAVVAAAEPDSWLPSLAELSERLSLSKTVLARAMRKLADEGLVRTRQGYGSYKV
jgi:hypothetical protein